MNSSFAPFLLPTEKQNLTAKQSVIRFVTAATAELWAADGGFGLGKAKNDNTFTYDLRILQFRL